MSEIVDFNISFEAFGRKVKKLDISKRMKKKLTVKGEDTLLDVLEEGANNIRNTIISSMQKSPPTGRKYTGGGRSAPHRASSPGNPPRKDSGDLIRSIIVDARASAIEVGSIITDPEYPLWLEEGTLNRADGSEKMEPRPWLAPAIEAHEDEINKAAGKALRKVIRDFRKG